MARNTYKYTNSLDERSKLLNYIYKINGGPQQYNQGASEIIANNKMPIRLGKRLRQMGCGEQGEQKILQAIFDEWHNTIVLEVTYLAAGFVIGLKGQSMKQIYRKTGVSIRPENKKKYYDNQEREVRIFRLKGDTNQLLTTVSIIVKAVDKYRAFLSGRYKDQVVKRHYNIDGVWFTYKPPKIEANPDSARTIDYKAKFNSQLTPSEYGRQLRQRHQFQFQNRFSSQTEQQSVNFDIQEEEDNNLEDPQSSNYALNDEQFCKNSNSIYTIHEAGEQEFLQQNFDENNINSLSQQDCGSCNTDGQMEGNSQGSLYRSQNLASDENHQYFYDDTWQEGDNYQEIQQQQYQTNQDCYQQLLCYLMSPVSDMFLSPTPSAPTRSSAIEDVPTPERGEMVQQGWSNPPSLPPYNLGSFNPSSSCPPPLPTTPYFSPTPTPNPDPTPTPTPTPFLSQTVAPAPTPTSSQTPTPTSSQTPTPTSSQAQSPIQGNPAPIPTPAPAVAPSHQLPRSPFVPVVIPDRGYMVPQGWPNFSYPPPLYSSGFNSFPSSLYFQNYSMSGQDFQYPVNNSGNSWLQQVPIGQQQPNQCQCVYGYPVDCCYPPYYFLPQTSNQQ